MVSLSGKKVSKLTLWQYIMNAAKYNYDITRLRLTLLPSSFIYQDEWRCQMSSLVWFDSTSLQMITVLPFLVAVDYHN